MTPQDIAVLPEPDGPGGAPRRVGIEVECGGVTEIEMARIVADLFGGTVKTTGPYARKVTGTEIGDVEILLDTALRDRVGGAIAEAGLDLGRAVIPVEFVTDPILPPQIARVDALCDELVRNGAVGTGEGILLGYGLHLNVACKGEGIVDILPVLRAFALTEDWLRARDPIDRGRRILPFVDPYPPSLLDDLAAPASDGWDVAGMIDSYLDHAPSRNHGLDMLPIFRHLDEDRLVSRMRGATSVKGRPAYHYRLPDCRIGDPDWSVAREWRRWCRIECFAADTDLMDDLRRAWRGYRERLIPIPGRWAEISGHIIEGRDAKT